MFAEVKVAEKLLKSKSKEQISESATIKHLDQIWASFEEGTSNHKKALKQMGKCTEKGSLFVCRRTPTITKHYELGSLLGSPGQYGICKEAVCIDKSSKNYKKQYAVKVINKRKYNDKKVCFQSPFLYLFPSL